MAKTGFESVDQYIGSLPEVMQSRLEQVRRAIRKTVPEAEEVISYEMPAYELRGVAVLCFARWKQHYSLYTATERVVAEFGGELAPYRIDKGTIRFPLSIPVPVTLIERIAYFRAKEITERARSTGIAPAISTGKSPA